MSTLSGTMRNTPWHLWVVGIVAVLFNAIGAFDHTMVMLQGAAYMKSAGMGDAQIAHFQSLPMWMMAAWAVGVWGAMIGSVLILLRSGFAVWFFAASLAAFVLNLVYTYALSDGGKIMGQAMMITNVVILVLLLFFLLYARAMAQRGVLR